MFFQIHRRWGSWCGFPAFLRPFPLRIGIGTVCFRRHREKIFALPTVPCLTVAAHTAAVMGAANQRIAAHFFTKNFQRRQRWCLLTLNHLQHLFDGMGQQQRRDHQVAAVHTTGAGQVLHVIRGRRPFPLQANTTEHTQDLILWSRKLGRQITRRNEPFRLQRRERWSVGEDLLRIGQICAKGCRRNVRLDVLVLFIREKRRVEVLRPKRVPIQFRFDRFVEENDV